MDVRLPKLGEGADSGVVVSVQVKPGDTITKGQTLIELESGKAVAPIPATTDGTVSEVRVKEGDKVSAGQVILTLAGTKAATATSAPAKPRPQRTSAKPRADAAPGEQPAPQADATDESDAADETDAEHEVGGEDASSDKPEPSAAPSVRRIARELNIDLRQVRASGSGGRVEMDDLRAYIERLKKLAAATAPAPRGGQDAAPGRAPTAAAKPPGLDFSKWGSVTRKVMTPLRKMISQRMLENFTTIPHVTQFDEADISNLLDTRKRHAPAYEAKGARLTVTTFILKAVATVLRKHPGFNASLDESTQEIVLKNYVHIGMAVDTEAGLLVPVIRDADKKSLLELSLDLQSLAAKARDRKLSLDELQGGTFTISNQGGIGGAHFTPIINKPEVAILGLGKGALRPCIKDNEILPRTLVPLAVSYDHRVIDGGAAARFIVDLTAAIEGFNEDEVRL